MNPNLEEEFMSDPELPRDTSYTFDAPVSQLEQAVLEVL